MPSDNQRFPADSTDNVFPILRRRKSLAASITIFCFLLCLLAIHNAAPIYSSRAQISFNAQSEAFIKTQMQYIASSSNTRHVISDLKISKAPELHIFPSLPTNLNIANSSNFKSFNIKAPSRSLQKNAMITNKVRRLLHLSHPEDSYIVDISYSHHNAQKAAQFLKSYIDNYIKTANEVLPEVRQKQSRNISPLLDEIESLKQAQTELLASAKSLTKAPKDPQYTKAKNDFLILKAQIAPYLNEDDSVNLFALNNISSITSKTIEALETQKRKKLIDFENLTKIYGEKHPKIKSLSAAIAKLDAFIELEQVAIFKKQKSEFDRAKAIFTALEEDRQKQQKSIEFAKQEYKKTLLILEKDFKNLNTTLASAKSGEIAPSGIVQIITPPNVPTTPAFPDKPKLTAIGMLISILIGLIIPVIIEKRRKTFLSGRQMESKLNQPCYALVPKTYGDKDKPLADYVTDYPASDVAEAVRALRLSIKLQSNSDEAPDNVILITSSKENEGKTTLCAWLGRLAAKSGERVLLIDANLRTPSIHKSLGSKNTLSIVEYLSGQNTLKEVIDTSDPSGLNVIYGRSVPNSALDLLSSDKMDQLLRSVKQSYDLIIIDTPASMANSDARALQKKSDLLLYIVAWNKTKRNVIHKGLSQFTKPKNSRIATVLSTIDIEKHIKYGYGEVINDIDG